MALVIDNDGRAVSVHSSPYVGVRETLSLLQRQLEDQRWDSVGSDPDRGVEDPYGERVESITRSRTAVRRSPLVKVAINLLQHYTLGQGVNFKAQNRSLVAKIVDELIENTANKAVWSSHQAQKEFLEGLYVDGDFFFVLFPNYEDGTLEVGTLDATLVEDPIPDPENAKVIHFYKVRRPSKKYDFAQGRWDVESARQGDEFVYYRHYLAEDVEVPTGMPASKLQPGLMMQVSVDKRGKFGRSQVAIALDWLRAHREFMEDRSTINKSAAAISWKKTRKGPASDIAAEATRLQSSIVAGPGRYEQNPAKASGAIHVQNEGSNMEWVKTETGGAAADFDERKLRMMAGAALGGIANHYFGDEGNSNLATATAMELPMLKMYEEWQQVLRETLSDIIEFGLKAAHKAGRIGENDLTSRYMDRITTPQGVMEPPPPMEVPGAEKPEEKPKLRSIAASAREALTMPYSPPPLSGGIRMVPRPDDAMEDLSPTDENSPTKPVSWYVDIDFPPIVTKELDVYMNALKVLSDLLPTETIESRKLVVELALQTFGVNDIDQTMERIFPADMVAVLAPPPPAMPGTPGGPPLPVEVPKVAAPVAEAEPLPFTSIASIRRRRLIQAADDAASAIGITG